MSPGWQIALALVGLVGGGGGIVALFKMRPEVSRVVISSAEGAVVVQSGVITDLRNEISRLRTELDEERRECEERIDAQDSEIAALRETVERIDQRRKEKG